MNYFDKYESIVIELKNESEINKVVNDINDNILSFMNIRTIRTILPIINIIDRLSVHEIPYIRYNNRNLNFTHGTISNLKSGWNSIYTTHGKYEYERVFNFSDYLYIKRLILSGGKLPSYKPITLTH